MTYEAAAVEKSRLKGNHGHNETVQREEGGEQEWERGALDETEKKWPGGGGKTRNRGFDGEELFRSVKDSNRASQVRMEEFPLAVGGPLVTLER